MKAHLLCLSLLSCFTFDSRYALAEEPIDGPKYNFVCADYAKGDVISGLEEAVSDNGKVFHAGTALKDGQVVTSGGRVLCATALGETVKAAQQGAYELARQISWKGSFYRSDIGYRAIARES